MHYTYEQQSISYQFSVCRYYQWIPVMLMMQAFFFYLPCVVWRVMADRSGKHVSSYDTAAMHEHIVAFL